MQMHIDKTDKIESIKIYRCGFCINNEAFIIKGAKPKRKDYPANVFLIKHSDYGYILFDTGYTNMSNINNKVIKLYTRLNPTFIVRRNEIDKKLEADNIGIDDIRYIILSHLHPDHIGGLKHFPNVEKIVVSRESYNEYKQMKLSSLIFKELIPDWFEEKVYILDIKDRVLRRNALWLVEPDKSKVDLFSDNSIIAISLSGHTRGQIGLIINNNVVLAADASWGRCYLYKQVGRFGRFIQHNMKDYMRTTECIRHLHERGYRVYFSHDFYEKENIDP